MRLKYSIPHFVFLLLVLLLTPTYVAAQAMKKRKRRRSSRSGRNSSELIKYGRGVVALANADFNRTKALADRFQRNELRLMARLLIAQSILRSLVAPRTNLKHQPKLPRRKIPSLLAAHVSLFP